MSEQSPPPEQTPTPMPLETTPLPPQPLWKAPVIKVLQFTIQQLQGAVAALEKPPAPVLETVEKPTKPKLEDRVLPNYSWFQSAWNGVLGRIRAILPASWNEKLSDLGLTAAIASLIVVILWTSAAIIPGGTDTKPIAGSPNPPTITAAPPEEVADLPPTPTPPAIEAPPELTAPEPPQVLEPEPPPPPVLTPEQSLIAGIQNQVTEITNQYAEGLIQSLNANFESSQLAIAVSDRWYSIPASKQDKLADDMLRRAAELDFSKLEISDLNGTLIARSPVVGDKMIVLKRFE